MIKQRDYQLYAKIRKDSKYWSHNNVAKSKGGLPFPIEKISPSDAYESGFYIFGGPGGNYRPEDLHLFVIVNGEEVQIS